MKIFSTSVMANKGKYDDNYQLIFKRMKEVPEAQQAFTRKLLDRDELKKRFVEWTKVLSEPDQCQNMVTLMNTFDNNVKSQFY